MQAPEPEEIRRTAAGLDERQRKVVVALVAAMIEHSDKVRDREWISERFARTVGVALADGDESNAQASIEVVQSYAQEHAPVLVKLAFDVFGRVALDLQQAGGPITPAAAMERVVGYVSAE